MRGRSRTGPSAIFDPPREHLDSCIFRADSDPRRLGVQALMSTCKDRANGCFHNGSHALEGACALSPLPWSRSPPRNLGRAILIKPQPRHRVNTIRKYSVHQPIHLCTLCIALQIESNMLGTFLGRAKEALQ